MPSLRQVNLRFIFAPQYLAALLRFMVGTGAKKLSPTFIFSNGYLLGPPRIFDGMGILLVMVNSDLATDIPHLLKVGVRARIGAKQ